MYQCSPKDIHFEHIIIFNSYQHMSRVQDNQWYYWKYSFLSVFLN